MKTSLYFLSAFLIVLATSPVCAAQSAQDKEEIRQAILDYVEGIYNVEPARIERSVHTSLAKVGFWRRSPNDPYSSRPMTFEQLVEVAKTYNKDGRIPKDAPKRIEILDVLDTTAIAKLVAQWGIDYMHLGKFDGKWKIVNVLWQIHPPKD